MEMMENLHHTGKTSTTKKAEAITFELHTPDIDHRPIYIAGNFNHWQLQNEKYRLQEEQPGIYCITFDNINDFPDTISYKYLKEDWHGEELTEDGKSAANRHTSKHSEMVKDVVPKWGSMNPFRTEFLPHIQTVPEVHNLPIQFKTRRVSVLLPHDYHQTEKRYPVLYLQDGQNLYEEFAPFGTWGVDKELAKLAEEGKHEIIVVAIDHAEENRIKEFTPSFHTRLGPGDGKKYFSFIKDSLKPYIDKTYRTLSRGRHTGLGGSSMGGLISIYGGLRFPSTFSKLMVFSPALWVTPRIPFHLFRFKELPNVMKIYLYAGGKESNTMIPNIERFKNSIEHRGIDSDKLSIKLAIDPEGLHNEARWGKEFPEAMKWLYY